MSLTWAVNCTPENLLPFNLYDTFLLYQTSGQWGGQLPQQGCLLLHLKWQMVSWWKPIYLVLVINNYNKSHNTSSLSSHRFPRTGSFLWSMAFQYITVCSGLCQNGDAVICCRGAAALILYGLKRSQSYIPGWMALNVSTLFSLVLSDR